jgi:Heparinase II/III-like protein/Heparinase II/III N-terminus
MRGLGRIREFLGRVRRAARPAVRLRRWVDDLSDGGVTADEWIARRQSAGRLYVDLADSRVADLRRQEPVMAQATLDAASRVLRHEFDLLGSGPYTPVDPDRRIEPGGYTPIDWDLDPVSGIRFPRGIPHTRWNFERMRPKGADIKFPWEISRCQHWPLLGQAYRLTGDDRYALEIVHELRDFMQANPIGVGVNWTCTMDVGLRAANWALGLELIRSCRTLPDDWWAESYKALFDHGAFIECNLENNYEVTSNHFLSNVIGLFYLAAVFRDLPRGAIWNRQCRTWLAEEMTTQVLADGADYESSVPYHRLVSELFLGAARLADYGGQPLPESLLQRLRTMVALLAAVVRPDGLMPQIGDADDGRLHILSGYGTWQPQDPRHLFGPAACFFSSPDWMRLAGDVGAWEAAWWGFNPPAQTLSEPAHRDGACHFPDAGWVVMRQQSHYLFISNGIVGTNGFGNHKHNDQLGFEYHTGGRPWLVDAGSYVYTSDPEARNLFRSTRSHNTVMVDGEEQNELRPDSLFRMFEKANPERGELAEHDGLLEYCGRHQGYTRLPDPVVHQRAFRFVPETGALTVLDMLTGRGTHRLRWHFHFAPGVSVVPRGPGRFDMERSGATLTMSAPPELRPVVVPAWYSPSYGVRLECVALELETTASIEPRRDYLFELIP